MLFARSDYFDANEIPNMHSFGNSSNELHVHFSIQQDTALSLPNAPYSGIIADDSSNFDSISNFIDQTLGQLREMGITRCIINQAPAFFFSRSGQIHKVFQSKGYQATAEINHHIDLNQWQNDFSQMQMRRVQKGIKSNLSFNQETVSSLTEIHEFISHCRAQQDLKINIDLDRLRHLFATLDCFRIHTVRDASGTLLACLVSIVVTDEIIYSYLPAFDRDFSALSPLSFLYYHLLPELYLQKFKIMDMGISSINGEPQTGLIRYKEGVGGKKTLRYSYAKDL